MFDPEKLLGTMLESAFKKKKAKKSKRKTKSRSFLNKDTAAMAMSGLTLAAAAYDHFAGDKPDTKKTPAKKSSRGPLDLFGLFGEKHVAQETAPAAPAPVEAKQYAPRQHAAQPHVPSEDALLLMRTMVAAANSDLHIELEERQAILSNLENPEDRHRLAEEFENPCSIRDIVSGVDSPAMAIQVYAAALLAIDVDSRAERNWLKALGDQLKLNPATVAALHTELEM